jgi:hypothetical protein
LHGYQKGITMNVQTLLQVSLLLQITPGRLNSIIAGLIGLVSVIVGAMALVRSAHTGSRRFMTIMALTLGLVCIVLSVLHLARTTGGFGTGKGRAGAIVALVLGLTGMILGGRARSRRIDKQ